MIPPHPQLSAAGRAVLAEGLPDLPAGHHGPPPEYGSSAWYALPVADPRRERALVHAAECWRLLCSSPHVRDLISEWVEWDRRRVDREASNDICRAGDRGPGRPSAWRLAAGAPTYRELERRRAQPACSVRCPGCRRVRSVWPPPTVEQFRCAACRDAELRGVA